MGRRREAEQKLADEREELERCREVARREAEEERKRQEGHTRPNAGNPVLRCPNNIEVRDLPVCRSSSDTPQSAKSVTMTPRRSQELRLILGVSKEASGEQSPQRSETSSLGNIEDLERQRDAVATKLRRVQNNDSLPNRKLNRREKDVLAAQRERGASSLKQELQRLETQIKEAERSNPAAIKGR